MIKKWLKLLKNDERGLTLVELLAVIVIIAIIGGIAFVSVGNVIDNSRADAHVTNAVQVINAAELQEASGDEVASATTADDLINIGDLIDPWDSKNDAYDFSLSKTSDGEFTVTSTHAKCSFTNATKEVLNQEGRDICNNGGSENNEDGGNEPA